MKSQRLYYTHILERIQQIERFTAEGEGAFMADDRTQEAVIRCFEVIGEAVKRLEPTLTAQHTMVSWRGFAGFRDVLIHQYDDIEIAKVWETVRDDLPTLKVAIEAILAELPDED
ncbi:MAG: DUF86 domain-containing protein [Anaerolineae bacterium]